MLPPNAAGAGYPFRVVRVNVGQLATVLPIRFNF
jgi:hypothetical protein